MPDKPKSLFQDGWVIVHPDGRCELEYFNQLEGDQIQLDWDDEGKQRLGDCHAFLRTFRPECQLLRCALVPIDFAEALADSVLAHAARVSELEEQVGSYQTTLRALQRQLIKHVDTEERLAKVEKELAVWLAIHTPCGPVGLPDGPHVPVFTEEDRKRVQASLDAYIAEHGLNGDKQPQPQEEPPCRDPSDP